MKKTNQAPAAASPLAIDKKTVMTVRTDVRAGTMPTGRPTVTGISGGATG